MPLTHQQPFSIEVWGNEKSLSQSFGQLDLLAYCRCAYRNLDSFFCESEFITGLLNRDRITTVKESKICARFSVVHVWENTWFAGISIGVSIPGSETFTDFRFMFSNFNWVSEDDGKVGKVFWRKQNSNIHLTWNLLSSAVGTLNVVDNFPTHINFKLHQSGTDKCYCCQDHAHCHPFQRSGHATWRKSQKMVKIK